MILILLLCLSIAIQLAVEIPQKSKRLKETLEKSPSWFEAAGFSSLDTVRQKSDREAKVVEKSNSTK